MEAEVIESRCLELVNLGQKQFLRLRLGRQDDLAVTIILGTR